MLIEFTWISFSFWNRIGADKKEKTSKREKFEHVDWDSDLNCDGEKSEICIYTKLMLGCLETTLFTLVLINDHHNLEPGLTLHLPSKKQQIYFVGNIL